MTPPQVQVDLARLRGEDVLAVNLAEMRWA
jgi:hypothetical protein